MNHLRFCVLLFAVGFATVMTSLDCDASDPARAKVVCFGDSITKQGYSEILASLLDVQAINAGVGGNTTSQALRRMSRDVLAQHPDVVVILFGTNDTRIDNAGVFVPLEKYTANLHQMIDACEKQEARVVLCTIPPINHERYFTRHDKAAFERVGGLGVLLTKYREAVVQVASQRNVAVVDLNQLLQEQPEWLSDDGVHASKEGVAILAKHIAKAVRPLIEAGPK
ncbi:Acetylxylan esterase precursor [Novipirellula galeiformis]|uniref:Acetylxylan esterase n=1 Tax=Novipirellula galeiformis TaxID=2528004 RepID=A0A5C6BYW5_9BACT|nr:GDSL-type esterase/lipase family protein [Novipirellula galeiformis]TWU17483.1 Acetylxylan esterase precursor [Novipirellula galeiformis]